MWKDSHHRHCLPSLAEPIRDELLSRARSCTSSPTAERQLQDARAKRRARGRRRAEGDLGGDAMG